VPLGHLHRLVSPWKGRTRLDEAHGLVEEESHADKGSGATLKLSLNSGQDGVVAASAAYNSEMQKFTRALRDGPGGWDVVTA
jgi:hypothetical protein